MQEWCVAQEETHPLEGRVDLDNVKGAQTAGLGNALGQEVCLAVAEAAAHGGSGRRCNDCVWRRGCVLEKTRRLQRMHTHGARLPGADQGRRRQCRS